MQTNLDNLETITDNQSSRDIDLSREFIHSVDGDTDDLKEFELQPASRDIWTKKYRLNDGRGTNLEHTVNDTFKRVARALASVEKPELRDHFERQFYYALLMGATPAGRIMSNVGEDAQNYRCNTSTINCVVSDTIQDSMSAILESIHQAGITLKYGCGIGYCFSTLRPKGAFVSGSGSTTSGPLSFMDIYDKMCFTISSAGGRRGAQMATFDVCHPDILDFIAAKKEQGRLRQFNLSVLITDDFMEAVKADDDWELYFPLHEKEVRADLESQGLMGDGTEDIDFDALSYPVVWKYWRVDSSKYFKDREGRVACRVYQTVKARTIWDAIMESTYDYAEPGFILIDEINRMNNNWFCEEISATNPCGEQPLPPNGACLLGSINLTRFVEQPFSPNASFNVEQYCKVIRVFTRMLDNVVELNGLPWDFQSDEIRRKRRHGMGFYGLGSALAMMGIDYDSQQAVEFTTLVSMELARQGFEEGVELAKEKGPAPIFDQSVPLNPAWVAKGQITAEDFTRLEGKRNGVASVKELFVLGPYIKQLEAVSPGLSEAIRKYGCRFTHHSSIAPTGTISLTFGNNCSNGIEPSFSHEYKRNVISEESKSKKQMPVFSYEYLVYKKMFGPFAEEVPAHMAKTSEHITAEDHLRIQAAAQKWIDSSISKTVNVPTDYPFEDFKNLYLQAYELKCKGCTTFRYNPDVFSGVLVKDKDLANTHYEFRLKDGTTVTLAGNEEVEYEGEMHVVSNLADAIKEGYYGKLS